MIDKVQKIREEVERLQKRAEHNLGISLTENERQFWLGESNVLTLIGKYIDSMQEEPLSDDLETEIERIRKYHFINDDFDKALLDGRTISGIARHFANWQKEKDEKEKSDIYDIAVDVGRKLGETDMKEQMMKEAVDGFVEEPVMFQWRIVSNDIEGEFVVKNKLTDGDKVKIIIIKED